MIYGITGRAGSGKDTVGDWFVREMDYEKVAMAGALKAGLAAMGFPEPSDRNLKESKIKGFGFSWREAAQKLGTEFGRALDPDLWLKLVEQKLRTSPNVVITDIRFENEAAMVREFGGTVIHITGRHAELGASASHTSEEPLMYYPFSDYAVSNHGALTDLETTLRKLFK